MLLQKENFPNGKFQTLCYKFHENHSKCVLSENQGVIFSANIDGKNGLLSGFEIGCILTEEQREQANNRINQILKDGK